MLADDMIWEFLPKGLKDVFKIVNVERQSSAFHVWLDELRQKSYYSLLLAFSELLPTDTKEERNVFLSSF
jgi:hypothetical protein